MKLVAMLLALVLPLVAGCPASDFPHKPQADAAATFLPQLHLQPELLDMGTVKEGEEARATLFIRNNSTEPVTIVDVQTSCGCTVAELESSVILPGGFTTLDVRTDTAVKQGDVKKWVQVTDSLGHTAKSILTLRVTENPHLDRTGRGLFDGKCRSCHYDPVQGVVSGKGIYSAACVMCHGVDGKGAYAPALTAIDDEMVLRQLIANGTGSPQMPGFAKTHGGPLTESQIQSLSRWLLSLD